MTLVQEMVAAGAGRMGSGNPMSMITTVGDPVGGAMSHATCTVRTGYAAILVRPSGSRMIAVEGTTSESVASVVVNGVGAAVTGTAFRAEGIVLRSGTNTISVTARDMAGNIATKTIGVTLDLEPPARPTTSAVSGVVASHGQTVSGTKTAGTSIWINGTQVVPLDNSTTWTATLTLSEGDNTLVIVAKDAAGNASTSATITLLVDELPPVVTIRSASKTNLTPTLLEGDVDDRLTTVSINGVPAARSGNAFSLAVPLVVGANSFHLVATSPNGHLTARDEVVTLGTIPTFQTVQPATASKVLAGAAVSVAAQAVDNEQDPIEYQVRLDGALLNSWSPSASVVWQPTVSDVGAHTVSFEARDGYGGSRTQEAGVYVVRPPVEHP